MEHLDFDDLVEYTYEQYLYLVEINSVEEVSPEEVLEDLLAREPEQRDPDEIPPALKKEYKAWRKKHPLKKGESILKHRRKFLKKRSDKQYKRFKKIRKKAMIYDPLFAESLQDPDEMYRSLISLAESNTARVGEFQDMVEGLVESGDASDETLKMFKRHAKHVLEHQEERIKRFEKEYGIKPTVVEFSYV